MSERCHRCDRPIATKDDWKRCRGGDGDHLYWSGYSCPEVDWRARALAAEKRLATMIQEGAFVDMGMQGLGVVRSVFGSEHKRQASVQCGDGSIVEVECAMLKPLPQVAVGDRVLFNGDEDGVVTRIERKDHGWDVWIATGTREFVTSSHHAISAHPNPLVRYAALIHSAERAVDGPATEQAKCIAALAKALREEHARVQRAKEALRSIAEIVRT